MPPVLDDRVELDARAADLEVEAAARAQRAADERQAKRDYLKSEGITPSALHMRERRKNPELRRKEKLAEAAMDAAYKRLAKANPEEFTRILNEERKARNLDFIVLRGRQGSLTGFGKKKPEVHVQPKPDAVIATCRHADYPMKKLSYGKFCGNCGKRI